jgi:hypothetical protein
VSQSPRSGVYTSNGLNSVFDVQLPRLTRAPVIRAGAVIAVELPAVSVGQWHHIAVVRTAGLLTVYLDGAAAGNGGGPIGTPTIDRFHVRGNTSVLVDDVAFVHEALTSDHVASIWNSGTGRTYLP